MIYDYVLTTGKGEELYLAEIPEGVCRFPGASL